MADVAVNLAMPEEKKAELSTVAMEKGLSISGLIRMVLYEYIEKENQQKQNSA